MSYVVSDQDRKSPERAPALQIRIGDNPVHPGSIKDYSRSGAFAGLIRSFRLHQWSKNILVFVPLLLAGLASQAAAWQAAALTMLALSLVASATYVVNDLFDLAHDREHPTKRFRPIASGQISPLFAALASGMLGGAGLALGWMISAQVLAGLCAYVVVTLAYSLYIKRVVLLDCLVLGSLFTLRFVLGIIAVGAIWSPWLLTFSMFLFTSLSMVKRYVEIMQTRKAGKSAIPGRGYMIRDSYVTLAIGVSASVASLLIFILYLANEAFRNAALQSPMVLWVFPLLLFLWIGRVWLLAGRGELHDDPVAFSVRDPISILLGMVVGVVFLFATFGVPGG